MDVFEISEIGKFIRKVRKERGLRLEDLSDDHISTATISNIERGVPHVNKDKVYYLMEKLDLDLQDIPDMMVKDHENNDSMELKFLAIETLLRLGNVEEAMRYLQNISENSTSIHAPMIHSLRGRYYMRVRDWRKAEREIVESNRLCQQEMYALNNNLEAVNYNHLAYCRYVQNDLEQALRYVDRGLESYQGDGSDLEQTYYILLTNRVIYLEKIGKTDEALKRLDELWGYLSKIRKSEVVLSLYALRADLFRRMKLHQDAIRYAREGIQMAVSSNHYDEMLNLWTILGTIFIEVNNLVDAETCFSFVLDLKDRTSNKQELVRAYCSLGNLYLLQGKVDEAKKVLQQAIHWGEKLNDALKLCNALIIMGKLMKVVNQETEAIQFLERAVVLADQFQYHQKQFLAYYELASCYDRIGDQERFREAAEKMYKVQSAMDTPHAMFEVW